MHLTITYLRVQYRVKLKQLCFRIEIFLMHIRAATVKSECFLEKIGQVGVEQIVGGAVCG